MFVDNAGGAPPAGFSGFEMKDELRSAMRGLASTVTIVTANANGHVHGTTATAVTCVSLEPPAVLVCLNKDSRLARLLAGHDRFCVNLLHADNIETAKAFSRNISSEDRFAHGEWLRNAREIPYLVDAQANLFCDKDGTFSYGTHDVFIGRVVDIRIRSEVNPLLYANGDYRRLNLDKLDVVAR